MGLYTVTYKGVDLLGKLLAGQNVAINGVYMEFTNGTLPAQIYPDPADGRDYYADLETSTEQGYLRIPLSNVPVLSTTDTDKFETNKATFFAMSTGLTWGAGANVPFQSSAPASKVYGIALVYMPDLADRSLDVVFSRSYDFSAITKEVGQEISMAMAHVFGESMISSS